ncbi:MAG TPA: hypothetical protein VN046_12130, partial [Stenotrophobium sp.]|nr:hypothetical protein [Stenotrophobium sp.]
MNPYILSGKRTTIVKKYLGVAAARKSCGDADMQQAHGGAVGVKAGTDTVAPVDRFIAKLYRSAFAVTPDEYRGWALREIAQVIPNDGGIWGSGSASRMKFHTCT